tara:strand:+ start:1325 stop:1642 length:318 start_codon:yes stop_codon:yes gene_type:complete
MIITIKEEFLKNDELMEIIENISITCSECDIIEDEQYQCTTCWSTNSKIPFNDFINTELDEEEFDRFIEEINNMENIFLWDLESLDEEYEYSGIPVTDLINIEDK